jgi:hypothetical protein
MNIEKLVKLANSFEYSSESYDERKNEDDYGFALQQFEDDYIYGASIEELHRLLREIKLQIEEVFYNQEETAKFEGEQDYYQPEVPKFLEAKRKLVEKAISKHRMMRY